MEMCADEHRRRGVETAIKLSRKGLRHRACRRRASSSFDATSSGGRHDRVVLLRPGRAGRLRAVPPGSSRCLRRPGGDDAFRIYGDRSSGLYRADPGEAAWSCRRLASSRGAALCTPRARCSSPMRSSPSWPGGHTFASGEGVVHDATCSARRSARDRPGVRDVSSRSVLRAAAGAARSTFAQPPGVRVARE